MTKTNSILRATNDAEVIAQGAGTYEVWVLKIEHEGESAYFNGMTVTGVTNDIDMADFYWTEDMCIQNFKRWCGNYENVKANATLTPIKTTREITPELIDVLIKVQ